MRTAALAALISVAAWLPAAPLPEARTEVTGAVLGGEIVVVGGLEPGGGASSRADAYTPETDTWRRLPDLPVSVHHATAASDGRRLFVVGGYGAEHSGFELKPSGWSALPQLPAPRAAAGSAVVGGKLYVVGGVTGRAGLTRRMLVYDIAARRWGSLVGPTPREHLAVTTRAGRIYALGGRTGGFDTNLALFEEFSPSVGTWHRLAPVPVARGGTGMAALGGQIVSVGGEAPGGTISSVYAYTLATRRWRQLPDLGTPRHGLAVVALRGRVYAIGGGPEPGLTVSGVNESLAVGR